MLRQIAGLIAGLSMAPAAHAASAREAMGDWLGPLAVAPTTSLKVAIQVGAAKMRAPVAPLGFGALRLRQAQHEEVYGPQ